MRARAHLRLAVLGPLVWFLFFLGGLPDYYQQYPLWVQIAGSALILPPSAWAGFRIVTRGNPAGAVARSAWLSFYFTVPFALLDALWCGVHLGLGAAYLARYWYLTIYYVIPWMLWIPMGIAASRRPFSAAASA